MKERPILFSASMVRAILNGSKTQTRRVIKPQPWEEYSAESIKCEHYAPCIVDKYGEMDAGPEIFGAYSTDGEWGVRCPYGHPGDRLWVRETFLVDDNHRIPKTATRKNYEVDYKATSEDSPHWRWRPSIHMPRWASRITLEINDIRVERLQDISEEDAWAEGCEIDDGRMGWLKYRQLWESINGAESWASSPWVWVIEFKRL